jgi:uncharacterized protein (DUF4415 family)
MFSKGVVRRGLEPVERREKLILYLDRDVLSWFRAQGEGYQEQINAVLRAYKEARRAVS